LETLQIEHCQQLEGSAPSALHLELRYCGKLQLDWATMKRLIMEVSLIETVGSDTLEHLSISYNRVCLRTFPLDFFPKLKMLILSGFGNLEKISQDQAHYHLEDLTITDCPELESLPANMQMLLPSLRRLHIENCPRLESFPDEGLLPLCLTSLTIGKCPNLEKLDYKGLCPLSSLKTLALWNCPNLQNLPEEGLPKSISHLEINDCPLLEQRCEKEGGEDWEKIAHIQTRKIW